MNPQSPPGTPSPNRPEGSGEDLFLSYSRDDNDLVHRILAELERRGRDCWVDVSDIPPADVWLAQIHEGIDRSLAFVFCLSPSSIASDVCVRDELGRAVESRKRIIPVVVRDFEESSAPAELRRLNYIFLREGDDFAAGMDRLTEALDTDPDHVRSHTKCLGSARQWVADGKPEALLLRDEPLEKAVKWLQEVGDKEPRPSPLHIDFIRHGVAVQRRRQVTRAGLALAMTVLLFILALTSLMWKDQRTQANQNLALRHLANLEFPQARIQAGKAVASMSWTPWNRGDIRRSLESLAAGQDGAVLAPVPVWISPAYPEIRFRSVAIGPENRWLVAAASDSNRQRGSKGQGLSGPWAQQKPLPFPGSFQGSLIDLALTRDGKWLAAACEPPKDKTLPTFIQTWENTAPPLHGPVWEPRDAWPHPGIKDLAWSHGADWLAAAGGALKIWRRGRPEPEWGAETPVPRDVRISPDDRFIAVAGDGEIALFDAASRTRIRMPKDQDHDFACVDFSPDGTLLAAGFYRSIQLWKRNEDGAGFAPLVEKEVNDDPVDDCRFSPDGDYLATSGRRGQIRLWRTGTEDLPELPCAAKLSGDTDPENPYDSRVMSVSFDDEGNFLLAGQANGTLRLWHLGRDLARLPGTGTNTEALDIHGETGRVVTARTGGAFQNGVVQFIDLASNAETRIADPALAVPGRDEKVPAMRFRAAWSQDGKRVILFRRPTAPNETCLVLLDAATGTILRAAKPPVRADGTPIQPVTAAFSRNLKRIVLADGKADCFSAALDLDSGNLPETFDRTATGEAIVEPQVSDVALSPEGERGAVTGIDNHNRQGFVRLFDPVNPTIPHRSVEFGKEAATVAVFHPDGEHLAVGCFRDRSIHVFAWSSGHETRKFPSEERGIRALAFDPDGGRLASGSLNRVRIWDWKTGTELRAHWVHRHDITAIRWVDAERLVTGSDDGTLRVLRLHDLSFPMRAYAEKGWLTEDPRAGLLWKTPAPEARPEFISPAFETRLTR